LWWNSKEDEEVESFDIEFYTVRKREYFVVKFGLAVGMFLKTQREK